MSPRNDELKRKAEILYREYNEIMSPLVTLRLHRNEEGFGSRLETWQEVQARMIEMADIAEHAFSKCMEFIDAEIASINANFSRIVRPAKRGELAKNWGPILHQLDDEKNNYRAIAPMLLTRWFEDPTGRHAERFYDGNAWTNLVRDGDVEATDSL